MDAIDKKILMLLQNNAKQNTKEIADQIGLSISPTFERIKRLDQKYIKKYVAIVDPAAVNKTITAFCHVSLTTHSKELIANFKTEIANLPEVVGCYHMSGNYDFLLKVVVDDMDGYQQFVVEKVSVISGISNLQSGFVMDQVKNETALLF